MADPEETTALGCEINQTDPPWNEFGSEEALRRLADLLKTVTTGSWNPAYETADRFQPFKVTSDLWEPVQRELCAEVYRALRNSENFIAATQLRRFFNLVLRNNHLPMIGKVLNVERSWFYPTLTEGQWRCTKVCVPTNGGDDRTFLDELLLRPRLPHAARNGDNWILINCARNFLSLDEEYVRAFARQWVEKKRTERRGGKPVESYEPPGVFGPGDGWLDY